MTEREIEEELRRLRRDVADLGRDSNKGPVRHAKIGAADSLPPPRDKFMVLQIIDDDGNIDWDRVRFTSAVDPF